MASERATIKPYPLTRRQWAKELDGIERFLRRLPEWEPAMGAKWVEKQRDYYEGRRDFLRTEGPPAPLTEVLDGRVTVRGVASGNHRDTDGGSKGGPSVHHSRGHTRTKRKRNREGSDRRGNGS